MAAQYSFDELLSADFDSVRDYVLSHNENRNSIENLISRNGADFQIQNRVTESSQTQPTVLERGGYTSRPREQEELGMSYEELLRLDENNVPQGLSAEQLGKIQRTEREYYESYKANSISVVSCNICMETYNAKEKIISLRCGMLLLLFLRFQYS